MKNQVRAIFFNLLALAGTMPSGAQAPLSFDWECMLGVPGDGSLGIASTLVQGDRLYFTGYYAGAEISFGDKTWRNSGGRDYITGCISLADGRPLWLRTAYGPGNEGGARMVAGPDGHLLVFGHYTGQHIVFDEAHGLGNFNPGKTRTALHGGSFQFYVEYDADGTLLDARSGNPDTYADPQRVAEVRDFEGNSYAVRGVRQGSAVELEDGSRWKSAGESDVLLVKRRPTGAVAWVRQFGGAQHDVAMLLDDPQRLTLAITYRSAAIVLPDGRQLTNARPGYESVGLIRLSADGAVEWVADLPFEGDATVSAGILAADGSVYLTGSTGTIPDGFVAKIGADGEVMWKKRFGGPGHDYFQTVCLSDAGLLAMGAFKSSRWYSGAGAASPRPRGTKDLFIVRIDPADGETTAFLQLGGQTPTSGNLLPVPGGFLLQYYGPPGCWFARLPQALFQSLPSGHYSYTALADRAYEQAGPPIDPPDYHQVAETAEPTPEQPGRVEEPRPQPDSDDSERTGRTGAVKEARRPVASDKDIIDAVEQQVDESLDKLKGKVRKLKSVIKG